MDEERIQEIQAFLGMDGRHLGNALNIVMETQKVGLAFLVKQFSLKYGFRIGYNKALRLIESLEMIGAISPPNPQNGRQEVLWKFPEPGPEADKWRDNP